MASKTKRSVTVSTDLIAEAKQAGESLSEYISRLHSGHPSFHLAYVSSIFRGFALLEMARVPIDPAYFELVGGCLGPLVQTNFRIMASSGVDNALPKASALLLGSDPRASAVEAILLAAQRAQVLHEGFIEAARLIEITGYR